MKGIILAGGKGSRLGQLCRASNKHLLPVGTLPMIYYPIKKMTGAGITDILIVTGTEHMGNMVSSLGSGKDFDCSFTYRVQDEAGGIAQALGMAESFTNGEKMCVILGDNIFQDPITTWVGDFEEQVCGAKVILSKVEHPERFGVAFVADSKIHSIVEKPPVEQITSSPPDSYYAVTGVYFYDQEVFSIIKNNLLPSARGELEITDVNNYYLERGTLTHNVMHGLYSDAGTHKSLYEAQQIVLNNKMWYSW